MEKIQIKLALTLALLISAFGLKAQNFDNAKAYQDYILAEQALVVNENIAYISKSLHDHKARQNEAERKQIVQHLEAAIAKVEAMPSFSGDNTLKEAAIEVFGLYKETYQVALKAAEATELSKQSPIAEMEAYFSLLAKAESQLIEAGKKFVKVQKTFDRTHKLAREENKVFCLFSEVAAVNAHCRKVFQAYARVSEHGKVFFEAMKKKQIESMEKSRSALIAEAETALAELQKVGGHNGNLEYLEKAKALTHFLRATAQGDFVEIIKINQSTQATFDDSNRFNKW
ncbi:MAG: hypothetical protein HC913_03295 [Microscillaceae bacterium]|nr:hypothetical protein [Microscillaceae bacterium]